MLENQLILQLAERLPALGTIIVTGFVRLSVGSLSPSPVLTSKEITSDKTFADEGSQEYGFSSACVI